MKKKYDYWLIIWMDRKGEEIHDPRPFQVGVHPKSYCDEIMKSDFTDGKGEILKDQYLGYELRRLFFPDSNDDYSKPNDR